MTVHELSQLALEWIWARPKPLQKKTLRNVLKAELTSEFDVFLLW
jgi:hypothetical protein